ncbi:MAG: hypothetical protein ACMZI0_17440 [Symbiopectobacterium sp.]|uniref:hypothetical protein n=1 Tax=Symbiopectobacterium sp. TaxID=2952789 RepID=UPI0039ED8AE5
MTSLLSAQFDHVAHRFVDALSRTLPHLTRADVIWRYEFARSAAMHVLTDADPRSGRLALLSQGLCDNRDDEQVLAHLLTFVSTGFCAPSHSDISHIPRMKTPPHASSMPLFTPSGNNAG